MSNIGHTQNSLQNQEVPPTCPFLVVDHPSLVESMLQALARLPTDPPSLYIDLEGVNLSRSGTISILQIYVLPLDFAYLVDVHSLGATAFTTTAIIKVPATGPDIAFTNGITYQPLSAGTVPSYPLTLRAILESPYNPKVIFDVRNDSDALFAHYAVRLAGMQDIQLMELATRRSGPRSYVAGLASCISRDARLSIAEVDAFNASKEAGRALFAPEQGGSYEVFNTRPLSREILHYCVADVRFLPRLWFVYEQRFAALLPKAQEQWRRHVGQETLARVAESQSPGYQPHGRQKARAPSGWA